MQTHIIKLDNKEDSRAVKWVSLARSRDKSRQILNTIRIDNNNLVAVDGHRLHKIETPAILQSYNQKTLKPLNNIPVNPQPVEYEEIDGDYPDWELIEERLANKEAIFQIAVDKKLLADLSTMPTGSSDMIILKFTSENEPIKVIAPDSYDKAEALIMPMQS